MVNPPSLVIHTFHRPTPSVYCNLFAKPLSILVVDDEPDVLDFAAIALRKLGYEVTTCESGSEAVAYYRKAWKHIDAVILDMVMPGMNGKETFIAMAAINPAIKGLLATGYSMNQNAREIMEEGVMGFLQKPFDQAVLSKTLAQVLRGGIAHQ